MSLFAPLRTIFGLSIAQAAALAVLHDAEHIQRAVKNSRTGKCSPRAWNMGFLPADLGEFSLRTGSGCGAFAERLRTAESSSSPWECGAPTAVAWHWHAGESRNLTAPGSFEQMTGRSA
jgi:hypothetical protein